MKNFTFSKKIAVTGYGKKILTLVCFVIIFSFAKAQTVYIPDYVFANWLYNHGGVASCMVGVQTMDTTCPALLTVTTISCSTYNIHDLTGIQYFKNLQNLSAWGCNLAIVPELPNTLRTIDFFSNQLTTLPRLPDSLRNINVDQNSLTSLPDLPPLLTDLECNHNQLTGIPLLPAGMSTIWVDHNPGLTCLPPIINFNPAGSLLIDSTAIFCLPNPIVHANYWPRVDTLPICDIFNPDGCFTIWNIQGKTFFDTDNDCNTTVSEPPVNGIKVQLYDSSFNLLQLVYTSRGGIYSFDTRLGNYHVRVDTTGTPLTVLCPLTNDHLSVLTSADSLDAAADFRLACPSGFDLGVWSIEGSWFRPAHNTSVHVRAGDIANFYALHCAGGTAGSVIITFTGPVSYVSPDSGAIAPDNVAGNSLTYNIADFGAVNLLNAFNIVVHVDSNVTGNPQVCFTVDVSLLPGDNNPSNNTLAQCFNVFSSYDPNNKEVYPTGDVDPAGNRWLTYTIHFQNTGNAPAENIHITDTLNSAFDLSTFQLLTYSHQPYVQILDGGIARFNFPNINLPDSATDELHSHGYVQYKIRVKSNAFVGTQISNTAFIYFDFNSPVATNTTMNTVNSIVGVTQVATTDFQLSVFPNPANDHFTIRGASHLNKKCLIVITDITGREVERKENANLSEGVDFGYQLATGVYFTEVVQGDVKKMVRVVKTR